MKFKMRPVKAVALAEAFAGFQGAHRALRGGKSHADLEVDMPDPVEAERVPQLTDFMLDKAQERFLRWAKGQNLKASKFNAEGVFSGGGITVKPGQWFVVGPEGPYALDHDVVADNFQGV